MTKQEYCESHETVAYYNGLNGLEIKGAEWEDDNVYIYCVSGTWGNKQMFHRCPINSPFDHPHEESVFIRVRGCNIPLSECIKTGKRNWKLNR